MESGMNLAVARSIHPGLLAGLGTVVFLANSGLLVLQLLAGRYLAPFIGSSVETWTCVIGVFLTGIALGNHFGGKLADRSPSTRTLGKLLFLGAISSLSLILGWTLFQNTGFDRVLPLGPRIPILAALFCLPPAFVLSLMTPLTIKLMLSDVSKAGRISGIVFAFSTLGCLLGNYATGFWLMADYTLNSISIGVAVGLAMLSVPMFLVNFSLPASAAAAQSNIAIKDDPLGFRKDIRKAFAVVFVASFCGMSLELTASRLLAPVLGVSIFTWTGIIGVMLAGTACGNYLGGVLADRGRGEAMKRFALLICTALGFAAGPAFVRTFRLDNWPSESSPEWWMARVLGGLVFLALAFWRIQASKTRRGHNVNLFLIGAVIGFAVAHPVTRSFGTTIGVEKLAEKFEDINDSLGFDLGSLVFHLFGATLGGAISLGLAYDSPSEKKLVPKPSGPLAICLFCAALFTGLVVLMNLFFQNPRVGVYDKLTGQDIVWNVMSWTFILFFLPMVCLGSISPQVICLSIPDTARAGRTAGTIYAWSTVGAIVGTFFAGYLLIDTLGMARLVFLISLALLVLAFVIGRLWENTPMLSVGSIVFFMGAVGLFAIGYGSTGYDLETKYYAIKVGDDRYGRFGEETKTLSLDHLIHSYVRPDDPTWLGYPHEEIQGELVRHARSMGRTDILVIGGGGYTFPRWVEHMMPDVGVDVVEIDPGVTEIAHRKLEFSRNTRVKSFHMDGRQFIRDQARKGHYQYVMQDAVNDLSVPYHLMTKEYNEAVKETLAPGGAYLLTLIDSIEKGALWRAAIYTMRESFPYVEILEPDGFKDTKGRHVYVIYGAEHPIDLANIRAVAKETYIKQDEIKDPYCHKLEQERLEHFLRLKPKIVLTDQYAPVDNLMSGVFRDQAKGK